VVRLIVEDTQTPVVVAEQVPRIAGAVRESRTDHVTTLDNPQLDRLIQSSRSHQVDGRQ
jgi:hypothetical protein